MPLGDVVMCKSARGERAEHTLLPLMMSGPQWTSLGLRWPSIFSWQRPVQISWQRAWRSWDEGQDG